jgi:3-oxoadipate enol-lactonase
VLVGAGIGTTIALRTSMASPDSVAASVLISIEDIEDDAAKAAEVTFLKAFAERARDEGLEAAWAPVLPHFPPLIGNMVSDAIPRSNPASIAAAAAIGYDCSFRDVSELSAIETPTLVIPGTDVRHPTALGEKVAATLPNGRLASAILSDEMLSAEDFGQAFAPLIREFLMEICGDYGVGTQRL